MGELSALLGPLLDLESADRHGSRQSNMGLRKEAT